MKARIVALTVVVLCAAGAAGVGIQRPEFDALQQEVKALDRRVRSAEARITLIQKKLARHLAGETPDAAPGRVPAPAVQGQPLEGRNLAAWKLAFE